MPGTLVAFAVLALAAVSLWWLQHPPRTEEDYRQRAAQTAESLGSYVATTRIWSREIRRGRATRAAAAIALEEAATGAASTASTFESWIPPRGLDRLRSKVAGAASTVTDALGRIHLAAERDEWQNVSAAEDDLRVVESQLARLADEARP